MLELIINILNKKGKLKAKDILKHLSAGSKKDIDKSELNSVLYKYQNVHFIRNADFSWEVKDGENKPSKQSKAKKPTGDTGYKIDGKISRLFEVKEGVAKGRKWEKRDLILDCENGKNQLLFTVWNNEPSTSHLDEGDSVSVEFIIKGKAKGALLSNYLIAKKITQI